MRFLNAVASVLALGSVGKRVIREDSLDGYVAVYEAYGNLTDAARAANSRMMISSHRHVAMSNLHKASDIQTYQTLRTAENCIFPLDVLIVQDLTGSHQGDFRETILKTLPAMSETLPITHPGSRFSLLTFRDKPINQLGELDDDCFTVQCLNHEDPISLKPYLEAEEAGGGWDYPENQYGTILAALKSPKTINWRTNPMATPLIVHITDSEPHFDGDGRKSLYPQLSAWGADYDEDLADEYCNNRYYPDPTLVQRALLEESVYLATIIVRPNWEGGRALAAWSWFNSFVGYPAEFVQPLDDDMDNWFGELGTILDHLMGLECEQTTTTPGPPPTTTTPGDNTNDPNGTGGVATRPPGQSTTTPEPTEECSCPEGEEGCCEQQPEVLIAILKRPKVLDVHLQGYADVPSAAP